MILQRREIVLELLFYKMIYDKQLKRSMKILEVLYEAKYSVTIKKLEELLDVSRKTVFTTLELARTLLPEALSLSISENNVALHNTSTQTIEVTLIEIAQKTFSFQILEHAFLNKGVNIHELAEKLFISVSALSVRIKHINKVLRDFNCRLSLYDLQFIGNEANIRYFGYTYFSEFQELYMLVCKEQLPYCVSIYESMMRKLKAKKMRIINYSHQQVTRLLLVTRDRLSVGKAIQIEEAFIERICGRDSYQDFRSVYRTELSNNLGGIEIPESEIVWAYVASFNSIIYFPSEAGLLYRDADDIQGYKQRVISFLEEMAYKLNIQVEDKKNFLDTHMAYLINTHLLTQISPVFQLGSSDVQNYIRDNLGNLHAVWYQALNNSEVNELLPLYDIASVSVQLTMISSQFIYSQKAQATKVLYSFEGEAGFVVYLETLAKTLLPKGVDGVFIYNSPITLKLVERLKPDIIVYNHEPQEELTDCKTLRMSFIPQIQEWTLLKELIINLNYK